jgi:hypothetical protein
MVTNWQFAGVAAYLLWCLCASLSDRFSIGAQDTEAIIDESDKNLPVA